MENIKKIFWFSMLATFITIALLGAYTARVTAQNENVILKANINWYKTILHHPSIDCHVRGGEFNIIGFEYDFATKISKYSYACYGVEEVKEK